ncbi:MAG TPA: 7-carboxy-7-deazaguanine synthase [Gemmatimonadaceae bacterium]
MYAVKEIFFTLQGEGVHAGRPAVFCRFSGCNLWTGLEKDRDKAVCKFCDTEFFGIGVEGGKFATADELAARVAALWPKAESREPKAESHPYVVCTGGEPLLQLDKPLIDAFHAAGFEVGVETNGTQPAPPGIDWLCVSPKADAPLVLHNGDELKLVFPQSEPAAQPEQFTNLAFRHFSLQPMDGPALAENTRLAVQYCLKHPRWRLSLQTHKLLGLR